MYFYQLKNIDKFIILYILFGQPLTLYKHTRLFVIT